MRFYKKVIIDQIIVLFLVLLPSNVKWNSLWWLYIAGLLTGSLACCHQRCKPELLVVFSALCTDQEAGGTPRLMYTNEESCWKGRLMEDLASVSSMVAWLDTCQFVMLTRSTWILSMNKQELLPRLITFLLLCIDIFVMCITSLFVDVTFNFLFRCPYTALDLLGKMTQSVEVTQSAR